MTESARRECAAVIRARYPQADRRALAARLAALGPIALAWDIHQTLHVLWKLADPRAPRQAVPRG